MDKIFLNFPTFFNSVIKKHTSLKQYDSVSILLVGAQRKEFDSHSTLYLKDKMISVYASGAQNIKYEILNPLQSLSQEEAVQRMKCLGFQDVTLVAESCRILLLHVHELSPHVQDSLIAYFNDRKRSTEDQCYEFLAAVFLRAVQCKPEYIVPLKPADKEFLMALKAPSIESESRLGGSPEDGAENQGKELEPKPNFPNTERPTSDSVIDVKRFMVATACLALIAIILFSIDMLIANYKLKPKYEEGIAAIESGEYQKAIDILSAIEGYKDSSKYIQYAESLIDIDRARVLALEGQYEQATDILLELSNAQDEKIQQTAEQYLQDIQRQECLYMEANKCQTEGDYATAISLYKELGNYKDSWSQAENLNKTVKILRNSTTLAACINSSLGVTTDGNIVFVGAGTDNKLMDDIKNWTDIVSIAGYGHFIIGLRLDGTVVSSGILESYHIDTKSWSDIVSIAAGDMYIVGLRDDGTVVAQGHNGAGQMDIDSWTDIIAISAACRTTVGLTAAGDVLISGYGSQSFLQEIEDNDEKWTDIVAISAGGGYPGNNASGRGHVVGLKSDGTVVAVGDNSQGQCNIDEWTNIVAVAAGDFHTVGLTRDGRVLTTQTDQLAVSTWTNIVAISAGYGTTLAVDNTGRAYGEGFNFEGQIHLEDWNNIAVRDEWSW